VGETIERGGLGPDRTECPSCGKKAVYHPQCGYAMAKLMKRLLTNGYIVAELKHDLRERASNMERARGFLLNVDVMSTPTPTDVEDLLT
jgi:hypothetical protein